MFFPMFLSLINALHLPSEFESLTITEILNHLIHNQNEYCMEVCSNSYYTIVIEYAQHEN